MNLLLLGGVLLAVAPADTLVLASREYHAALAEWVDFRVEQGHVVQIVEPAVSADLVREQIRESAGGGALRYVVLIGDAPVRQEAGAANAAPGTAPIPYVSSRVNVAWGGAPHIASDNVYADLKGDSAPELSVGRIPCHTAEELRAYLRRVIREERQPLDEQAPRVTVVASSGRFTPFIDSVIEATARQVFRQLIPPRCEVCAIHTTPTSEFYPKTPFRSALLDGLRSRSVAWVYLGHGNSRGLDRLVDEPGQPQMLTHEDLAQLVDGPHPTVAALIACQTGCLDAPEECLAERMLLSPGGPLAVIASSRVSMPYGNSVLGIEMLNLMFRRPLCAGDLCAEAKRRALIEQSDLPLRKTVQQIGLGTSPNPSLLPVEVEEHIQMYNLLGDPLLRVGVETKEASAEREDTPD
ncbi:MAG: hypothetical protein KDA37_12305 [Planctomycetales bacterium]|nr:hypothetical protein [Planctomycetales bacterium]